MKDLILTTIHKYNTTQLQPFLNSIDNSGFDGHKVAVIYDLDDSVKLHLIARGFQLYEFKLHRHIAEQRFTDSASALKDFAFSNSVSRVIMVDCRDLVFQYNPTHWLDLQECDPIVFSSEGIKHQHEPWNKKTMIECYGQRHFDILANRNVINAGVIAGDLEEMISLMYLQDLWIGKAMSSPCDQSSLNIIVNQHYGQYTVTTDSDAWALQLHVKIFSGQPLKITSNGILVNDMNQPYCIVHQYDRSQQLDKIIKQKYQ
jgi:hypothetical protein